MLKKKKWYYPVFCLIFILIYLFFGYSSLIFNDYTWHITAGKWMVENHEILKTNIFSWFYPEDKFLFSHEWLAELIMYYSKEIFKIDWAFFLLSALLAMFSVFYSIKKDILDKDLKTTLVWAILLCLMFSASPYARPFLLGFVFYTLLVKILNDIKMGRESKFYLFYPLLVILWANIHGGTVIFAILGPIGYLLAGAFKFDFKKLYSRRLNKNQVKKYLYLVIGNILATFVNPNGIKMFYYSFAINTSVAKQDIAEWANASIAWPSCYISIGVILLFLVFLNKKIEFTDFGGILAFILLTSVYGRFYSWLVIYFLIIGLKYCNKKEGKFFEAEFGLELILLCLVGAALLGYSIYKKPFPNPKYEMSEDVVETLKEINPQRLYNSYDTGGILSYNGIKPFGMSLAELYDENDMIVAKYLPDMKMSIKYLDRYNFDYYLVYADSLFHYYAKANPDKYEIILDQSRIEELQSFRRYVIIKNKDWEEKEYDEKNYVKGWKEDEASFYELPIEDIE